MPTNMLHKIIVNRSPLRRARSFGVFRNKNFFPEYIPEYIPAILLLGVE